MVTRKFPSMDICNRNDTKLRCIGQYLLATESKQSYGVRLVWYTMFRVTDAALSSALLLSLLQQILNR